MRSEDFLALLPPKIYCAGAGIDSLLIRSKERAVSYPIIQPNHPSYLRWMVLDIDRHDAWEAPEKAGLPNPNFISVNRANGHAHAGWLLEHPVSRAGNAYRYYDAVRRGFSRRLKADINYKFFICKNPLHSQWETDWQAGLPYDLDRLNDYLNPSDRAVLPAKGNCHGRNCSLFDSLRQMAYRRIMKIQDRTYEDFLIELTNAAIEINQAFSPPLPFSEVKATIKSVAKWTWEKFSPEKFRALQSWRGSKPWGRETLRRSKPWEAEGISRATWFRRKGTPDGDISDMDTVSN